MTKTLTRAIIIAGCALSLSACEGAKEQLGLTRQAPDEFAVVKRAPLEMPPDYTVRPPRPGAPRPQEIAVAEEARNAVLGETARSTQASGAEAALLQQTGGVYADPSIRGVVDAEATISDKEDKPVATRLLGLGSGKTEAQIVNPAAEAERIRTNAEAGKPVTDGETPSIKDK